MIKFEGSSSIEYGSFWRRFFAQFIDGILLAILTWIITSTDNIYLYFMMLLIPHLYEIILIYLYGATLGKMILGLKVVSYTGNKLSIKQSIIRNITKVISMLPLYIGYLWYFHGYNNQTWHDITANTIVIEVDNEPIAKEELQKSEIIYTKKRKVFKVIAVVLSILLILYGLLFEITDNTDMLGFEKIDTIESDFGYSNTENSKICDIDNDNKDELMVFISDEDNIYLKVFSLDNTIKLENTIKVEEIKESFKSIHINDFEVMDIDNDGTLDIFTVSRYNKPKDNKAIEKLNLYTLNNNSLVLKDSKVLYGKSLNGRPGSSLEIIKENGKNSLILQLVEHLNTSEFQKIILENGKITGINKKRVYTNTHKTTEILIKGRFGGKEKLYLFDPNGSMKLNKFEYNNGNYEIEDLPNRRDGNAIDLKSTDIKVSDIDNNGRDELIITIGTRDYEETDWYYRMAEIEKSGLNGIYESRKGEVTKISDLEGLNKIYLLGVYDIRGNDNKKLIIINDNKIEIYERDKLGYIIEKLANKIGSIW